jgi:hypothetical protein
MIYEATEADIPALIEVGKAFHAASNNHIPLCLDTLETTLRNLIASPDGVVLMTDKGSATGALLHPAWFNAAHRTGMELFWWAPAGDGLALFEVLEEWARANDAGSFGMVALEALRPDAVGALYRRRGYRPVEHSYVKVF